MTIELPPSQKRALTRLMKAGDYASPEQVVAEGLRLLQARQVERAAIYSRIREEILAGARQIRARRVSPLDQDAVARIKARGRKILADGKSKVA